MARKLIYIGPLGPFFYDDTDPINEESPTELRKSVKTDGAIEAAEVASDGDLFGNLQGFNEALKKSFLL